MKHDHGGVLDKVRHELPTDELLCDLSDLFKLFGDTKEAWMKAMVMWSAIAFVMLIICFTRIKILFSLFESEMCVCAIAELLGMTQSAISHQLRILKDANLVGNRREGKTVYYYLSDDHVRAIVAQGFEHLIEESDEIGTITR